MTQHYTSKRFTKRLSGLRHYNYAERLQLLQLETLEARRRVKADLILCYKIVPGHVDLDKNELFNFAATSCTRGHDLKIVRKHSVVNARAFHFSNRVIYDWNALSYSQVHACSVAAFKRSLTCDNRF